MDAKSNRLVSVVVVSGGRKEYWRGCLHSVARQSYAPVEIILIDTSEDKGLRVAVRREFPRVIVLDASFRQDVGYGSALNAGIAASSGDLCLCLNDDVELDPRFIEKGIQGFLRDPAVGAISGKVLRKDKATIDSCGLMLTLFRTARERGYGRVDQGQFEGEGYVFGATGAVAFYRRVMLESIREGKGYFDERFGIFYEDLDLAWRAARKGWTAYYLPAALAYHARGASVRPEEGIGKAIARRFLSDTLYVELLKNRYLTIAKNETVAGFLLHLPFIAAYDCASWAHVFARRPRLIPLFWKELARRR